MNAIEFPQQTHVLAKDQPEYTPLPVYVDTKEFPDDETIKQVPWYMTFCYELTDEEIQEIIKSRKIWYRQNVMGNLFQPVFASPYSPFDNPERWPEKA